jgi:hypothetical protein
MSGGLFFIVLLIGLAFSQWLLPQGNAQNTGMIPAVVKLGFSLCLSLLL